MITRRSWVVYGALIAIWAMLIGWQVAEHIRVRDAARTVLIDRAKYISNTLGLLMRSRGFAGVISRERLEAALNDLVSPGELNSVVLLNATEEVVASAGPPLDLQPKGTLQSDVRWEGPTVTLVNLVDLGTNMTQDITLTNVPIVMPIEELRSMQTNRPPLPRASTNEPPSDGSTNAARRRGRWRSGTNEFRSFTRPSWMKVDEYESLIQKKGVHKFLIGISAKTLHTAEEEDIWLRAIIALLATMAVAGYGLAWRNLAKSSDLQIRLVRTSELNSHLKDMNLAAAGLAHETRNPLNIVRGLAQMISKQPDAPAEVQRKAREILGETDRVTAQLNEFINYSRPREVRRAAVDVKAIFTEVARTLNYDIEEKKLTLQIVAEDVIIEADEQLLRQALFNLVLNATQAAVSGGEIRLRASRRNHDHAFIEISDNGPGVAPEHRDEVFKPYFTTNQKGTGLGLAVVQQIILAHGWEIQCLANEPVGALFRINHVKLSAST